ncbi:hypothetical protein CK203_090457 [Vitis vinifera]|uniref:Uncharacterized protein n=1 Tax=Vitis vinifera TaxID=29760 RepID=A0A438BVK4_VITVI|nr:hypothetical protein CK203_090457 [Vitis vinifera]
MSESEGFLHMLGGAGTNTSSIKKAGIPQRSPQRSADNLRSDSCRHISSGREPAGRCSLSMWNLGCHYGNGRYLWFCNFCCYAWAFCAFPLCDACRCRAMAAKAFASVVLEVQSKAL